ncbi:MAG: hypothetical protein ACHQFZ_05730 [Acidimicrobiales bacterium]
MVHRSSTWWRVLGVVLLSLVTAAWPSAARAAPTPSFTLVHQDAVATLGAGATTRIAVAVRLSHADSHAEIQLSLYPRLITRSALAPLLNGATPAGAPVSTTGNLRLTCNPARVQSFLLTLATRAAGAGAHPCTSRPARLRLPCRAGACDGVYPLGFSVTSAGVATTEWSLVAVRVRRVASPVHVDLVYTLDPSALAHPRHARATLAAVARHRGVPVALSADYRTLEAVARGPASAVALWRGAIGAALASPLHRAVVAPPGTVDCGGLAAAGLLGQVSRQVSLASDLLRSLTGRFVDAPIVVSGHPSAASLAALAAVGARDVVLDESALATPPSTTLAWGAPFRVPGARGVVALATDQGLGELATNPGIEPARRAVLTLDTLAFLHYEMPNAPAVRTVVVSVPAALVDPAFVSDLLGALAQNPYVTAASLLPSFDTALVASDGAPAARALAPATPSSWSPLNVTSLTSLAASVASFTGAVTNTAEATALRVALAQSELLGGAGSRQAAIDHASALLIDQLNRFSVDAGTVTLTGPGTPLPVTIFSREPYTVTVVVHLITDRLTFPRGANVAVSLDAPVKSLRVATANHRGSSLTLRVVVTTPDGRLTLARAAVQVRIAGTSVVGYLLTGASLAVIGLWWWRTNRRRSKGRHAR